MASSKSERLKAALKNLRERTGPTVKSSAMSVGGGALGSVAFDVLADRITAMRSHWAVEPGILFVAGHIARKKNHDLGVGLLGAAGYALAKNSKIGLMARGALAMNAQGVGGDAGAIDETRIQQMIAQGINAGLRNLIGQAQRVQQQRRRVPEASGTVYPRGDAGAYVTPDAMGL